VLLEHAIGWLAASGNEPLAEVEVDSLLEQSMVSRRDMNENELVDLARAGDQDAFGELYRDGLPQIKAVGCEIFRGAGPEADLEDFCSDVWLLALKYLSSFRGECRFSTWIVRIARHRAIAIMQRRAQQKNGDDRLVYQGRDMSDEAWEHECSASEDRRLDAAAARSDVVELIRCLAPGHRELVRLYHLDGLTETEIAGRKGLSVHAVRGRLSRAMVQLRKKTEKGANRNGTEFSLTK
jgi:RNA polymerase sigma-70 factor, ECF subfamily